MCGRYYMDIDEKEFIKIIGEAEKNIYGDCITGKIMFKNLVSTGRCIVPASYYFEWKRDTTDRKNNEKYIIEKPDSLLYMAGLYNIVPRHDSKQLSLFNANDMRDIYYTIITKESNNSVSHIHDRMPLIFDKAEMIDWLNGKNIMESIGNNNHMLISKLIN